MRQTLLVRDTVSVDIVIKLAPCGKTVMIVHHWLIPVQSVCTVQGGSCTQDAESDSSICRTGAIRVRQLVDRVTGPPELGRDVWHTFNWCFCWAHVRADHAFLDL